MISRDEAMTIAEELFEREVRPGDAGLVVDAENVEEKGSTLIVPFNYPEFLETRDAHVMALDCWPIIVDLESGNARVTSMADRGFLNS